MPVFGTVYFFPVGLTKTISVSYLLVNGLYFCLWYLLTIFPKTCLALVVCAVSIALSCVDVSCCDDVLLPIPLYMPDCTFTLPFRYFLRCAVVTIFYIFPGMGIVSSLCKDLTFSTLLSFSMGFFFKYFSKVDCDIPKEFAISFLVTLIVPRPNLL